MPPLVVAGGIAAIGTVAGAYMNKKGNDKAVDARVDSTDKALAFNREQAAMGDAAYQEKMAIWESGRQELLKRYGIDIAPPSMLGSPGGTPGGAPQPPPGAVPRGMTPQGMTPGMAQAKGIEGRSLGQLASRGGGRGAWNDWSTMGLRGGGNA